MKILKMLMLAMFSLSLIISCQKNINNNQFATVDAQKKATVQNGVVTFATTANYLIVTENKTGEQQKLISELSKVNFTPLNKSKATGGSGTASIVSGPLTTNFDPTKYTDYLLSILNEDKICSINGYYVKVDMDNEFCSAIDQSVANGYNLLKNNDFLNNNPNVMLFTNVNEPVLEVLDQIRNDTLTWASYQDQLARKGGQGICLKSGHAPVESVALASTSSFPRVTVYTYVRYKAQFLSFELYAECYQTRDNNILQPGTMRLQGSYDWVGVCKNSGKSPFYITGITNADGSRYKFSIYQGGSALRFVDLSARTYLDPYGLVTGYASIY